MKNFLNTLLVISALLVSGKVYAAPTTLPLLSAGSAVSAGDLLLTRQGADTSDKKITAAQLKTFALAGNATSATTAGTLTTALLANQVLGSLTAVAPTGLSVPSCSTSASALLWTSGSGFSCNSAIVAASTTGNAATVTNGVYTTDTGSVTNTMLAGSIALSKYATQATNTVVGNATSGSAAPTALAVGSCSTSSSALNWTTNTGFGCNTSIVAASTTGNAATVTTNANLTGVITSSGNATSTGAQSGTGNTFMMTASPTATGTLGAAAISATSTVTGTAFIPSSSTIPTDGLYKPTSNTSGIADNSQPVEEYLGVSSAVDYMLVTNSATGNPGNISYAVTGTDTNIGENHTMKGVGLFTILYTGADSAGNNGPFTVDASGSTLSGNPAFKVVLPAAGAHKAFQFSNGTDTTAWASFQFDLGGTGLAGLALGAGGSSTRDLFLYRAAANVLSVGTASGNSSGIVKAAAYMSLGTKFTTSGCSVSSTTGGAMAGTFTLGANNCTVVVTMNGATGATAPNGWTCQAHDRTSISIVIDGESSSTTTTASIVIPVTAGATDVISFSCIGY